MSINQQVIDLSRDTRILIHSNDVVDHITNQTIRQTIVVDINLYNVTTNTLYSFLNKTLTFLTDVDYYSLSISDIIANLSVENKYVARFVENDATGPDYTNGTLKVRPFYLKEFCVTENRLTNLMSKLPYRIRCQISGGSKSYIEWGKENDDGFAFDPLFHAPAFQGGTGNTFATTPERVTHRGTVLPFDANRYL
jgi:hypothetical protein